MKNYATIAVSLLLITTFGFGLPQDPVAADAQSAASSAAPPSWPRTFQKEGNTLVMYQPQVDSWDKRRAHPVSQRHHAHPGRQQRAARRRGRGEGPTRPSITTRGSSS